MDREYQEHLKVFASKGHCLSRMISWDDWGDKAAAEKFLEKYWLPKAEYQNVWKPIHTSIFTSEDKTLPELVFNEQYKMIALRGGSLFDKKDFKDFQECLLSVGDRHFVIIENTFGGKVKSPTFQMKFPSDITWQELISGNYISSMLVESMFKEYFVFGDTGSWGLYAANDYKKPLILIGFKPEYSSLFREKFKQSDKEWQEIKEWLPPKYKDLIKN